MKPERSVIGVCVVLPFSPPPPRSTPLPPPHTATLLSVINSLKPQPFPSPPPPPLYLSLSH